MTNSTKNHSFSSSTIAPGKSGNKNVHVGEKYRDTKFPKQSNFIA